MNCINRFTNPFSEESKDLFNLVTKVVMLEKVKEDLCQQSVIGNTMLCRFVEDRIKSQVQHTVSHEEMKVEYVEKHHEDTEGQDQRERS